jgi:cyclophilin family peptidyl-prolyl cis-trans isomerase
MKWPIIAACLLVLACKKDADKPADTNTPTEKVIEIETSFGNMYMWLYKQTPLHRANFVKLASEGYFNNTTFHRIIPNFMNQGGDPNTKDSDTTNDGSGGPGYTIPAEFVDSLKHIYGAVGAARDNNPAKASSGSQFYIVQNKNGYPSLNKQYTVFGQIIGGMDVALEIAKQSKNANNRPYTDIKMQVRVLKKTKEAIKKEYGWTATD